MNLIGIADECVLDMKQKYCGDETQGPKMYYKDTSYIAILADDQLRYSTKHSILDGATRCLLIHHYVKKIRNEYDGYYLEFIDKDGTVNLNRLDDDFKLCVVWVNNWSDLKLRLITNDNRIYCELPLKPMPVFLAVEKMWNLYIRLKEVKSIEERLLISQMYQKDEKILQQENEIEGFKFTNALLEKERDMYKGLLEDIKQLFASK